MTAPTKTFAWTSLTPPLRSARTKQLLREFAKRVSRSQKIEDHGARRDSIDEKRRDFVEDIRKRSYVDELILIAAGNVIADLAIQGWPVKVVRDQVRIAPPPPSLEGQREEKERIRAQELVNRDAQLRQPSVERFVCSMEQPRYFGSRLVSIFSLMRDGRSLAQELRRLQKSDISVRASALKSIIDPYIQPITSADDVCEFTGLRLMDIWRYFRHTWTNPYMSVPGRTMQFLVRDRAATNHPVVGIFALSSPIMQIRERDNWIGWSYERFVERIQSQPTAAVRKWLISTLNDAVAEIYADDLFEDNLLTPRDVLRPSPQVVSALQEESVKRRAIHHRLAHRSDYRAQANRQAGQDWTTRARTHLFRSKRAATLSSLLKARLAVQEEGNGLKRQSDLLRLISTRRGKEAVRIILRKAKADRVGIYVADISVCGAIQPYNAILGGKLTAMLATSPEVVKAYEARYRTAESEIASSMAGRPIIRLPQLALLGTTSLYGVGSSQYNRIRIPSERLGGCDGIGIRYLELGRSEAYGTSHYSDQTVDALTKVAEQSDGGQRVNSIFGEGVSPKLRKVRQGLDALGFPSDALLQHHRKRIVYGISLITNLGDFLVGIQKNPQYVFPMTEPSKVSMQIADWWRERWLAKRLDSDQALAEVELHTLSLPISHGARPRAGLMTRRSRHH